MTSYVLALMIALQVGQGIVGHICRDYSATYNGWECIDREQRPRPQDLMPLVEPLRPNSYLFVSNWDLRQSDPLVVPAIQERYLAHHKGDFCSAPGASYCAYGEDDYGLRWTCRDKTNVLQVSEDGSGHWCVRF